MPDSPSTPDIPPPGSDAALDLGCTCDVIDNGRGRGSGRTDENGEPLYWVAGDCPVHAQRTVAVDSPQAVAPHAE